MENDEPDVKLLGGRVTRRRAIEIGALAAMGLAFSKPLIETIRPPSAFAAGLSPAPGGTGTLCDYDITWRMAFSGVALSDATVTFFINGITKFFTNITIPLGGSSFVRNVFKGSITGLLCPNPQLAITAQVTDNITGAFALCNPIASPAQCVNESFSCDSASADFLSSHSRWITVNLPAPVSSTINLQVRINPSGC